MVGRGSSNEQSPPLSRAYRRIEYTQNGSPLLLIQYFEKPWSPWVTSAQQKPGASGARFQSPIKNLDWKGIFVLQRHGSQVYQWQVAGTPGQQIEIDAGGDGWLVPWIKEKAIWLKFSDLKTREIFPNSTPEQPDWKTIWSILNRLTINAHGYLSKGKCGSWVSAHLQPLAYCWCWCDDYCELINERGPAQPRSPRVPPPRARVRPAKLLMLTNSVDHWILCNPLYHQFLLLQISWVGRSTRGGEGGGQIWQRYLTLAFSHPYPHCKTVNMFGFTKRKNSDPHYRVKNESCRKLYIWVSKPIRRKRQNQWKKN